jgi:hypothetical protein
LLKQIADAQIFKKHYQSTELFPLVCGVGEKLSDQWAKLWLEILGAQNTERPPRRSADWVTPSTAAVVRDLVGVAVRG